MNIATIIKQKGIKEVYSPIFGNGEITKITNRIHVKFPKEHNVKTFHLDGKYSVDGEIMLFPNKFTKDWFEPGDYVVACGRHGEEVQVFIYKGNGICLYGIDIADSDITFTEGEYFIDQLASDTAKLALRNYLLDKQLFYNSITNKIEKIVPKFDPTKLTPFEKVLVRPENSDVWECDFFSSYNPNCSNPFHCVGIWTSNCIPYNKDTRHLLGTTNNPPEFYEQHL